MELSASSMLRIVRSRCGGRVERCHAIPHNGSYNNAAHSWGVAMLMWELFPEDFERLVIYCLSHDIAEGWVGDIPSPVLTNMPEMKHELGLIEAELVKRAGCPAEQDLPEEDYKKLKACDGLELYLWASEQLLQGNRFVEDMVAGLEAYFEKNPLPSPADELWVRIKNAPDKVLVARQQGVIKELTGGKGL